MNNLDKLEEEMEEERWLWCERLLCLMWLVLWILWLGICFVAIFYISMLR